MGLRIGPFNFGGNADPAGQAGRTNTVHRLTGTVTGNQPGTVLVRITSVGRGTSGAVIGTTMAVPAIHRFPVGSAVQVTEQAGDPPVLTVEPLT